MEKTANQVRKDDRILNPNGGKRRLDVVSAESGREGSEDVIYIRCSDKPNWSFTLRPNERVTVEQ